VKARESGEPDVRKHQELRVEDISKSFPGVIALSGASVSFLGGQVHALVGENGAGKSTLVKILAGVHKKDSGRILVDGEEVDIHSPRQAGSMGISVIHQEFSLFPELTATQNLFIGIEDMRLGGMRLNKRAMERKAREILLRLGLSIATNVAVKYFSVAEQQLIEIAKCLLHDSWLIVMDEPTSALSKSEKETLFKIIRDMRAAGVAIIYISHHLEEIAEIADKVSVLRDGRLVGTYDVAGITQAEITSHMVGKDLALVFNRTRKQLGTTALEVRGLGMDGKFEGISLELHEGEVLGLCGLLGFGHADVCEALFGLEPHDAGEILLEGKAIRFASPLEAIRSGVLYVPEDRKRKGFIQDMNTEENLSLMSLAWISRLGWIDIKRQGDIARSLIERLSIKVSTPRQKVTNLSGGNQQKVVIGKCLSRPPRILILNDPTRGIDVGAKEEIYKIIDHLANQGVAIIMISSELSEYVGLCDRVLVFRQGKIVREFHHQEFDQREMMAYMLGTAQGVKG
jgi:ABC-type sugar transport system ATPase subunit